MPMTVKNEHNKRVWDKDFLVHFRHLTIEDKYINLISGLFEAGFREEDSKSYSPLSRVVDMVLEDLVVRLYLVELSGDHVICYRVGIKGKMESEDTDTIFQLGLNTIWEDIRRVWVRGQL